MASFSQIRLHQLTGSAVDLKNKLADYKGVATAAAFTGSDGLDLLGGLAAAVQKIHGQASDEVFNADAGSFYQDLLLTSTNKLQFNDTGVFMHAAADGKLLVESDGNVADAILLHANGGTSETIKIHSDQGTSVTEGAASVQLLSDAGGVGIKSTANLAGSIRLTADGGVQESIILHADQGTGEGSIQLLSDAGGVDIDAAAAKDVNIAGGQVALVSKDDAASAISLTANQGTSETIVVTNTQGTADGAISLVATVGGVLIDQDAAGKKIHLDSEGSLDLDGVKGISLVNASAAGGDDIVIQQTGANDSSVQILAAGTGTDAIDIDATAGDMLVGKSLADGKTLKIGKADAVEVTIAPHGTPANEKFSVVNTEGTDNGAVMLHAVAGGLVLSGSTGKKIVAKAGAIDIQSRDDTASAIKLHTNIGSSETIFIHNQAGTDNKAVEILAEVGGVDIFAQAAGKAVSVRSEQGGVQLSGSVGIGLSGSVAFSADNAMRASAGLQTGTMAFANFPGEFATFRSKDIFTRETSVIGALNQLADAAAGGVLTKKVVTASIPANNDLVLNAATLDGGGTSGFVDAVLTTNIVPSNTEVYVNGQLLLSGTSAPGASVAGGDYTFRFDVSRLRFGFELEADDVVLIKTTAAQ